MGEISSGEEVESEEGPLSIKSHSLLASSTSQGSCKEKMEEERMNATMSFLGKGQDKNAVHT